MTPEQFRDTVFNQFARMGHAFSSKSRLVLMDILAQGERSVEVLARRGGLNLANTSRHLQILKTAGLAETRREGVQIYYRLADPMVHHCWKNLQSLAENRLAEVSEAVRTYFREREGMEPVPREELLRRAETGEVVVLDVRPVEEFEAGHIAGAVSIPLPQLKSQLDRIPGDRDVVAYCRGPYCVLAMEAVELLRNRGFNAFRLQDGFPEWKERELPVDPSGEEISETTNAGPGQDDRPGDEKRRGGATLRRLRRRPRDLC